MLISCLTPSEPPTSRNNFIGQIHTHPLGFTWISLPQKNVPSNLSCGSVECWPFCNMCDPCLMFVSIMVIKTPQVETILILTNALSSVTAIPKVLIESMNECMYE